MSFIKSCDAGQELYVPVNPYVCRLCGRSCKNWVALAHHLRSHKEVSNQMYYDTFLKGDNEGSCIICGKLTSYESLSAGYKTTCSSNCACTWHRQKLKNDTKKFERFREITSACVKDIWANREDIEKQAISERISEAIRSRNEKLTQQQRNEMFGWLNRYSGEERRNKAHDVWNASLGKWIKDASQEQLRARIEKSRKTKLGDRYFSLTDYDDLSTYRKIVRLLSGITYINYKNEINPNDLPRGRTLYHLDHKYEIVSGFINGIPPYIIACKGNLQMLWYSDNIKKRGTSSITKEALYELYEQSF